MSEKENEILLTTVDQSETKAIQSPLNKAANDKFFFIFTLPPALKNFKKRYVENNAAQGIRKEAVKWSLSGADVPAINIKADAIPFGGGNMYISSHTKSPYDSLTIKMKIDNQYNNYLTAYEWINFIYDESRGHYDANLLAEGKQGVPEYTTNVSLVALDEYNKPVVQWLFTNAFPTQMSSISLNFQSSDEIELTLTFMFSQMKIRSIHGSLNLNAQVS